MRIEERKKLFAKIARNGFEKNLYTHGKRLKISGKS